MTHVLISQSHASAWLSVDAGKPCWAWFRFVHTHLNFLGVPEFLLPCEQMHTGQAEPWDTLKVFPGKSALPLSSYWINRLVTWVSRMAVHSLLGVLLREVIYKSVSCSFTNTYSALTFCRLLRSQCFPINGCLQFSCRRNHWMHCAHWR